jgi:hypothetical protein
MSNFDVSMGWSRSLRPFAHRLRISVFRFDFGHCVRYVEAKYKT